MLHHVATLLTRIYFFIVFRIFELINCLKPKECVSRIEDEILFHSATSLASKIRHKELASESVVNAFIKRCREVNPLLNAIVQENFENALNEAKHVDQLIMNGRAPTIEEAPFLGVPFTLKDHIFVNGFLCTAGMYCRRNTRVFEDADVVRNMKRAGAIFLAMTNVPEMCSFYETNNTIYGRSKNPYDTRRIVGGSSGGEGALISAAGSVFGIGSDIGGSIRMPAYFNGIFGHKPTGDVLSDKGLYPACVGHQQLMCTAGPMCRYAEDLLPMLTALAGSNVSKLTLNKQVDFSRLRIFYMDELHAPSTPSVDRELKNCLHKVIKYFDTKYNVLSFKLDLTIFQSAVAIFFNDMAEPGAPGLAAELTDFQGEINPLLELGKWCVGKSPHTYPVLLLALAEKLSSVNDDEGRKLKQMREELQRQFEDLLGDDGVFLFPPHPTLTPFHIQPCWMLYNWIYTGIFNSLTLPATSCPMGMSRDGTPVAVQVVGAHGRDHVTIAVARELEKEFGGWMQPGLS